MTVRHPSSFENLQHGHKIYSFINLRGKLKIQEYTFVEYIPTYYPTSTPPVRIRHKDNTLEIIYPQSSNSRFYASNKEDLVWAIKKYQSEKIKEFQKLNKTIGSVFKTIQSIQTDANS